jgi:hypothetical protein
MASLRALRGVARMRCRVVGDIVRTPATPADTAAVALCRAAAVAGLPAAMASNMACTWATGPSDGKQAVKACAEDHVKPAENDYCSGWYIRNHNTRPRTLTVYPDAPIRMTVLGEMKPVTLERFLSQVDNGNVIRFDIDANRIMKLEHIYLP